MTFARYDWPGVDYSPIWRHSDSRFVYTALSNPQGKKSRDHGLLGLLWSQQVEVALASLVGDGLWQESAYTSGIWRLVCFVGKVERGSL